MVLNRRIKREFRENIVRYLSLFLLIIAGVSLVVGFASSTDTIQYIMDNFQDKTNVEDGHITTYAKLSDEDIKELEKQGIEIEKEYYVDYEVKENVTIRLFANRVHINKMELIDGNPVTNGKAIVIDEHFAKTNNYNIGDTMTINNEDYIISGYGVSPDYTLVIRNITDLLTDPSAFGIGYMNKEDFEQLEADLNDTVIYGYSFRYTSDNLSDSNRKDIAKNIKSYIAQNNRVTLYYESDDNQRITSYAEDIKINKTIGFVLGVILLVIIAFMLGLTCLHTIDKESTVLGALYSLGYSRKELIRHFMILPIIVTAIASIIGTLLGFYVFNYATSMSSYAYYSYPNFIVRIEPYLFLIGIFVPIIITAIVNYFMILKRLRLSPLQLLRKDIKKDSFKNVNLNRFSFITKFRTRVFLREIGNNITLLIGIIFATFLLVIGFGMKDSISNYTNEVSDKAFSSYMYLLKAPIADYTGNEEQVAYVKPLKCKLKGSENTMEISVLGLQEENPYININLKSSGDGLYVSEATAKKFGIKKGDIIHLEDASLGREYDLKVLDTCYYPEGLYAFMNINSMRTMLEADEQYYNVIFSDNQLSLDENYVSSCITNNQITKSADNLMEMMMPVVWLTICVSVMIYIVIMYLLLKMMIDKSANHISLIKIFGYNSKEISKLYLGSTFYTVLFSVIIALPICRGLFELVWPYCIANVQGFIMIHINPATYVLMGTFALLSYGVTNYFLKKHLNRITLSQVLKERE